jgi:hypothetical protein
MDLVNAEGREIGSIEGVVENAADTKRFVLIKRGGFLGLGTKQIAIPLENFAVHAGKVTLRNMDATQLDEAPRFNNKGHAYRKLDRTQQISLPQQ